MVKFRLNRAIKALDPADPSKVPANDLDYERRPSVAETQQKSFIKRLTPVIACGAGLFSDGYLNQIISPVNTIFSQYLYPVAYTQSSAQSNVAALVFVGEVVGIFFFGYTSDHYSRKWSLFASTIILLVFAALSAGAYGAGGTPAHLFQALAAYRFLLGIGIGGEYPAGSVGAAECTGELKSGSRNRWFIFFSNFQIDLGFVVAALVSMIVVLATGENHLRAAWRIMLGIGVIPPLSLIYMRYKLEEPEAFKRESMAKAKTPWKLIIKTYWPRLLVISAIWFIYDFSSYAFGTYSTQIITQLLASDGTAAPLWKSLGWGTLINLFYIPGSFAGAFVSDWIGPRKTLVIGVFAQAIIGYIMAGVIGYLNTPHYVGAFVVVYGIFLTCGEFGPGDNIGLVASKTCPTAIRGQYYAMAAAGGKIGAFVGTYVFPIIQRNAGPLGSTPSLQAPFWVASSLAIFSGLLATFLLPHIGQDTIDEEDVRFRAILHDNGYDTNQLGLVVDAQVPGNTDSDELSTGEKDADLHEGPVKGYNS